MNHKQFLRTAAESPDVWIIGSTLNPRSLLSYFHLVPWIFAAFVGKVVTILTHLTLLETFLFRFRSLCLDLDHGRLWAKSGQRSSSLVNCFQFTLKKGTIETPINLLTAFTPMLLDLLRSQWTKQSCIWFVTILKLLLDEHIQMRDRFMKCQNRMS